MTSEVIPIVSIDEDKAKSFLGGPKYEYRMSDQIVSEVEMLLHMATDHNIAENLTNRTQIASPEVTRLIQLGLFSPTFQVDDVPYVNDKGEIEDNPEPYKRWEALKIMRTVASSIIIGFTVDHLNAVDANRKATIRVPFYKEGIIRRKVYNARYIMPHFFSGFSPIRHENRLKIYQSDKANDLQDSREFIDDSESVIFDVYLSIKKATLDVLNSIRFLDKNHPLSIMERNLMKISEYGIKQKLINRSNDAMEDPTFHFIVAGVNTFYNQLSDFVRLVPLLAKKQKIKLSRKDFVTILRSSISLMRILANDDLFVFANTIDHLKEYSTVMEGQTGLTENTFDSINSKLYNPDYFKLVKKGNTIRITFVNDPEAEFTYTNAQRLGRKDAFKGILRRLFHRRGFPRVIARCPARQKRAFGKNDAITDLMELICNRLNKLNQLYQQKDLL